MSSTVDEIAIKLGIQTGDLKAALADTNSKIQDFSTQGAHHVDGLTGAIHETHKAFRLLHQFLLAGGLVEAVKMFYEKAISYAEKHKELTDENTEAVRRFGETLKDAGDGLGYVASRTLGFFARAGEGWGQLISAVIYGMEKAHAAQEINISAAENLVEIAKKHAETLKEIGELENKNAELETKNKWAAFEALDHTTQRAKLAHVISEEIEVAATLEKDSLKFQETKNEVLTLQGRLLKLIAEDEVKAAKESAAAEVDRIETAIRADEDRYSHEEFEAEKKKKALDALIAATKLEGDESERVAREWEKTNNTIYQTVDGVDTLIAKTQSYIDQWNTFSGSIGTVGGSVQSLSDVQLNALVARLTDSRNRQKANHQNSPGDEAYDPILQELNAKLMNAQDEVNARRNFAFTVKGFGSQYAEEHYSADQFSRLSQLMNPDQAKAQAKAIGSIAGTLKNVFPSQYVGG